MANVVLKTDFKDGDKLFAQQLNNNFSAIVAALAAMNKISWQDNVDESLMYFKGTTEEVAARDIVEGQLLYDYTLGAAYIDHDNNRIDIVSGSVLDVVVNSMDGFQTNKAPSVAVVKIQIGNLQTAISALSSSKLDVSKIKNNLSNDNDAAYSCNYLNKKINLLGKTITMNSDGGEIQNIPVSTETIVQNTTNQVVNQFENDEITYSNGVYTINSDDIHTVLVNAQTFWNTSNSNFIYVFKNNIGVFAKTSEYARNQTAFVVNVEKNDTIKIGCYTTSSNTNLRADINNMSQITVLG